MPYMNDYVPTAARKVFLGGRPKSAGKTTFALSAPGRKLLIQYDLGNISMPPAIDPALVYWRAYQAAQVEVPRNKEGAIVTDRWKRPTNVGEAIINDAEAIRDGFLKGGPIRLNGDEIELPDVLILDGMTEMPLIMTDWVLGVNNKFEADDFIGDSGKVNHFKLWQKRLEVVRSLLHWLVPLPCSVVLIGWEIGEVLDNKPTVKIIPDIGGKLDNLVPGKVDAALRCFATYHDRKVAYKVQCQPDGVRDWIGIRGVYGMPFEVDVTITKQRPLPWEVVFGGENLK